MSNGSPSPTLAELVRMDWLILENKRLIDDLRRSIASRSAEAPERAEECVRYAKLMKEQKQRIAERQNIRQYFANQGRQ